MAREPINLNAVAPEARVVQPADIYTRPYVEKDAGSGYMDLARSLGVLGSTLKNKQEKAASSQGQADYSYYQSMANEFGQPNNDDIIRNKGKGIFDLFSLGKGSTITRNKVEEVNGDRSAVDDYYGVYGPRLLDVANDPVALAAEIKTIKKEAWDKVNSKGTGGDAQAYGNSYFKQLDTYLNGFQGEAFTKQAAEYEANEAISISQQAAGSSANPPPNNVDLHDHVEGSTSSLFSYMTKGKPKSYIDDLNPKFASRIQTMIDAAPPEIRSRIRIESGARTPQRQAELISAKLSGNAKKTFDSYIARFGAVEGGAQWAAANPGVAKARGIGHSIALPGRSQHQHGNAIDFGRDPVAEAWMHKNAGKYGLYYPMGYEPWHIEMVGSRNGQSVFYGGRKSERNAEPSIMGPTQSNGQAALNTGYRGYDNSPNFFDNYYKVMTGVENTTGDPNAKNPRSSATGNGQVINSTWLEWYKGKYGDTGESSDEILAKRGDPNTMKEVSIYGAKQNAKILESSHLPVNTTTLLMAHQLGASGAGLVLLAMQERSGAPIESVLSEGAMKANPQYSGMTVAQVYARAANKTGEFTNPVGGGKEKATMAYHKVIGTSRLGPVKATAAFANGIIDTATASKDATILDNMPDEIMAIPGYAEKVAAARDKIATDARQEYTFNAAMKVKADKEKADQELLSYAQALIKDPNAVLTPEVELRISNTPDGVETLKKIREFKTASMNSPEQKQHQSFLRAEAAQLMIQYAHGEVTDLQVVNKINEINDPALYESAIMELAKYRFVPDSVNNPIVKEAKSLFLESNYKYVQGTSIPNPDPKKAQQATRWYNIRLAAKLAQLGRAATEEDLFGDGEKKVGIIEQVETEVLNKVSPMTTDVLGGTGANKANQPPAAPQPPNPATGLTPEQDALRLKYNPFKGGLGGH